MPKGHTFRPSHFLLPFSCSFFLLSPPPQVQSISMNADSTLAASCSQKEPQIKVWTIGTALDGQLAAVHTVATDQPCVRLAWLLNRVCYALVGPDRGFQVHMHNLTTGEPMERDKRHDHAHALSDLVSAEPLRVLLSACVKGTIKLWDEHNQLVSRLCVVRRSVHNLKDTRPGRSASWTRTSATRLSCSSTR
jgi:WD40 repeat protein